MATATTPRLCFVIMPFSEERKEVYKHGIAPACQRAGFAAVRVDELKGHFNINRKIIEHIFSSDAVIAEISDHNPNVFYEMGVAHAIGNKTIMIAQNAKALPFDISNYRCLIYKQSVDGLKQLQDEIVESLRELEKWSRHPSNPVQDFKPFDAFVTAGAVEALRRELAQKEALLRASAPKAELDKLRNELRAKENLLSQAVAKAELETLQQEIAKQAAENARLRQELERSAKKAAPIASPALQLRSQRLDKLAGDAVKAMLRQHGFYCAEHDWSKGWSNPSGKGVKHNFEVRHDGQVVVDHATGLSWQQSGSPEGMTYANAEKYIIALNDQRFASFNDWRLPTLEEAMSLMEPKKSGELYLDPVFDRTQKWIWTADLESAGRAWYVYFDSGGCHLDDFGNGSYVRAVRS